LRDQIEVLRSGKDVERKKGKSTRGYGRRKKRRY
jgi:hypothetical protein